MLTLRAVVVSVLPVVNIFLLGIVSERFNY